MIGTPEANDDEKWMAANLMVEGASARLCLLPSCINELMGHVKYSKKMCGDCNHEKAELPRPKRGRGHTIYKPQNKKTLGLPIVGMQN